MKLHLRPFVILDRDGTLIEEKHYLSDPCQVELIPGVAAGLHRLRDMGLGLVVITNQSGVGRKLFDMVQLELVHRRICQLLNAEGVWFDGIYFCPHLPDDHCSCRKPAPRLVEQAAQELGFDPRESFVIGDKACDIELGQRVGATTILVRTGYGTRIANNPMLHPDYVVGGIGDAVPIIIMVWDFRTGE